MHYKLNPPPYVPGSPQFYGAPNDVGAVYTNEAAAADAVIRAFGKQGPQQKFYVKDFYEGVRDQYGNWSSYPVGFLNQIVDIGKHFVLNSDQAAAVNKGTANVRVEFQAGANVAPALDENGEPVFNIGAYSSGVVTIANVGSEYTARCNAFQRDLNAGKHGGQPK